MTRSARRAGLAVVVAAFACASASSAASLATAEPAAAHFHAAERLAEVVTLATGVPISPLVGVSALGGYRWWRTPPAAREALPWYTHPGYWGTGLALALLFAVNSTLGALVPGLKKPMDFVEQYENQVSALVASPIVVFEAMRLLDAAPVGARAELPLGALGGAGVAAVAAMPPALAWLAKIGTAALVLFAFVLVFLAFHAIQVLIALSPSAILDLGLRLIRFAALSLSAMAASVHPYVGAAFGLLLLLAASLVAGWAFRLLVYGSVFARDLLAGRRADDAQPLAAFSSRGLTGLSPRAYGRIEGDATGLRFVWRPWLVLPRRSASIAGPFAVRRGALSPVLIAVGGVREPVLARFPPRYKGAEASLVGRLGATELRDGRLVRGLRAAWTWLRETVRGDAGSELVG